MTSPSKLVSVSMYSISLTRDSLLVVPKACVWWWNRSEWFIHTLTLNITKIIFAPKKSQVFVLVLILGGLDGRGYI